MSCNLTFSVSCMGNQLVSKRLIIQFGVFYCYVLHSVRDEGFYLYAVSDENICVLWASEHNISRNMKVIGYSPEDGRKNDQKCRKHSI